MIPAAMLFVVLCNDRVDKRALVANSMFFVGCSVCMINSLRKKELAAILFVCL